MHWRIVVGALALGVFATPALAGEPLEWAQPDSQLVLVFNGADTLAEMVDGLEKRYGDAPALKSALAALRGLEVAGISPAKRQWGGGLAPGRGVGLFAVGPKQARFVVGADALEPAKKRLADLMNQAGGRVEVTPAGLQIEEQAVQCALRDGLMVCDTAGPVPEQAPGKPAWVGAGPRPWLLVSARGEVLREMERNNPLTSLEVRVTVEAGRVAVRAEAKAPPMILGALAPLRPEPGAATGLETVDGRSGHVAKIALDGPKLMAFAEQQGGGPPPPIADLWAALKAAWTGDVVVSAAGGLTHPVLAIGLTASDKGPPLVQALVDTMKNAGLPVSHDAAGAIVVTPPPEPGVPPMTISLPYRTLGKSLVFALARADLDRIEKGELEAPRWPAGFEARGTHGFLLWDLPALLYAGFLPDLLDGEGWIAHVKAAQTLMVIYAMRVEELGATFKVLEDGVRADLWWSLL